MWFLVRAVISAATYVETKIFGEIVNLPATAFGVTDTEWGPRTPEVFATSRNFPAANICPRLRLVHEGTSALVGEFWYRPDPDDADSGPRYDCPAAEDEKKWLYARLLSKDSHYYDVGYTLLAVAISFSSLLTQLQLTLQCLYQLTLQWLYSLATSVAHHSRFLFAIIFLVKLVALTATSFARVRRKLSRDPGDLRGRDLGRRGRLIRTGCMVLFYMFDVPGVVSDVLNLAHTHKPFQPFAVFRTGGSRVWIVGWPTRSHFQVDMEFSSMANLTVNIFFDMTLLFVQFFLPHDMQFSVWMNMIASLLKLFYSTYKFYTLRFHRKRYREYQTDEKTKCLTLLKWQRESRADPETIRGLRGRARALCRDLTYHFGEPYPHKELSDEEVSPHPPAEPPLRNPTFAAWFERFKAERARRGDPATEHLSPHPADQDPLISPVV